MNILYRKQSKISPKKTSHHLYERPLPLHGEVRARVLGGGDPHDPEDRNACLAQPHVHRELTVALDEFLPSEREISQCIAFAAYDEILFEVF